MALLIGRRRRVLFAVVCLLVLQYLWTSRQPRVTERVRRSVVRASFVDLPETSRWHQTNNRTPVEITIVIPHYRQTHLLEDTLESVFIQGFTSFEILVVNDGGPPEDVVKFDEFVQEYANRYPARVYYLGRPTNDASAKSVPNVPKTSNRVTFFSKVNTGLADTRNFALSNAVGEWICALDADDQFLPGFWSKIVAFVHARGENITGAKYDVIITDLKMRTSVWRPIEVDNLDPTVQNPFHVSALFRRSFWDRVKYRRIFFFGWEDWDFWLNILHQSKGKLRVGYVREPLVFYSVGTMHKFCVDRHALCRALFRTANANIYKPADLVNALKVLFAEIGTIAELPAVATLINLDMDDPTLHLWSGLLSHQPLQYMPEQARYHYSALVSLPPSDNYHHIGRIMLDLLDGKPLPTVRELVSQLSKEADAQSGEWEKARACRSLEEELIMLPAGTPVFHQFITRMPESPEREVLTRYSTSSVFRFHPNAVLVLHVSDARFADNIYSWFSQTSYNVKIVPLCTAYVAAATASEPQLWHLMRNSTSPFFYSHITDFYRYAVLFHFGGTYMDTDIVLAASTSGLGSAIAREETGEGGHVNGAFMSFARNSMFMAEAIDLISVHYDPNCWNCIGPVLLTGLLESMQHRTNEHRRYVFDLPPKRFYMFGWRQVQNFTGVVVSDEEWANIRRDAYGFHFWGRVLFGEMPNVDVPPFVRDSVADRALRAACSPGLQCPPIKYTRAR